MEDENKEVELPVPDMEQAKKLIQHVDENNQLVWIEDPNG